MGSPGDTAGNCIRLQRTDHVLIEPDISYANDKRGFASYAPVQWGVYAKPLPFARREPRRLPIADCRVLTDIGRSCHTTFSIVNHQSSIAISPAAADSG